MCFSSSRNRLSSILAKLYPGTAIARSIAPAILLIGAGLFLSSCLATGDEPAADETDDAPIEEIESTVAPEESDPEPIIEPEPESTDDAEPEADPAADASSLSMDDLQNVSFTYESREVTLEDGVYQEFPPGGGATMISNLSWSEHGHATGDLDGDGDGDIAAALIDAPGGSGTFISLMVFTNEDGAPVQAGGEFIGDRTRIEDFRIVEGEIQIDVVTHGEDDPMCCPSQEGTWRYALEDGALTVLEGGSGY